MSHKAHHGPCCLQRRLALAVLLLTAALVAGACRPSAPAGLAYEKPEQLDDGWEVSSLAEEGLDGRKIAELTERVEKGRYGLVHSCLIVRHGRLVYERYFRGYRRDTLHNLYSVTKSVTSALVGIALEKGYIPNLQDPVVSYFPEYADGNWDQRKNAITLEHLLMMASGLQYNENPLPYSNARNSHTQMTGSADWMKWALEQPLLVEPGTQFNYSSANTHLFSGILYKTTGRYADELAEEYLFGPLGIANYFWYVGDGFPATSGANGGLQLRPRDMAKFGTMYLQGGRWKGQQVVPQAWVEESLKPRLAAWSGSQYGYQWWIHPYAVGGQAGTWFAARGYGDQLIGLFPALDMVVVFACGNEGRVGGLDDAVLRIVAAAE